jgi:exonuclease SbcC
MTAFGPYAGEEVIDFTKLGGRNIFLITGPTGAGKTTVFDGISYAVFGIASSEDRDGESLRSHFAKEDLLTSVELEFELRGRRYLIRRIPKQNKPKARGEGFTEQKADAELRIFKGSGPEGIETFSGVSRVNDKVNEILGINHDQFRQIMMIPQGEFRKLITEESTDREKILQKIFGTEGFRKVQDRLFERSRALTQQGGTLETRIKENMRGVDPGEDAQARELLESGAGGDDVLKAVERLIEEDGLRERQLAEGIKEKEGSIVAQNNGIALAEENNRKFQNKEAAAARKEELDARQEEYSSKEKSLENARRAIAIVPVEENAAAKEEALRSCRLKEKAAAAKLDQAQKASDTSDAEYEKEKKREPERSALQKKLGVLEGLRGKVSELEERNARIGELKKEEKKLNSRLDALRENLKKDREEAKRLEGELRLSREAKDRYFHLSTRHEGLDKSARGLKSLLEANSKLEEIRVKWAKHKAAAEEAEQHLKRTMEEAAQLNDMFFKGQAGFLATDLREGEPCPVCGSKAHPEPAARLEGAPDKEAIEAAEERRAKAQKDFSEKSGDLSGSRGEGVAQRQLVDKLKVELADDLRAEALDLEKEALTAYASGKLKELKAEMAELSRELLEAKKLKDQEESLAAALEALTKTSESAQKETEEKTAELADLRARLAGDEKLQQSVTAELPEGADSTESLEKLIRDSRKRAEQLKAGLEEAEKSSKAAAVELSRASSELDSAKANSLTAEQELGSARKKFGEELRAAGFTDAEEYRSSKLTRQQIDVLDADIKDYLGSLKAAADALIKAEQEIEGLSRADTEALRGKLKESEAAREALKEEKEKLHARVVLNGSQLQSMRKYRKELTKIEEEYSVIGRLTKIARGDNAEKITFERYVLAAFFDDIISAANLRLTRMTGSRYEMQRKTDRSKGNAQSGLELEVLDNYTGRTRHIKTLSGGESFKASLSLALGLADVVQSYAGGISLDTMFVDEGFGTLDPESLDAAVQSLVELQSTGRLVGIISHVPELKERIDARLEITPGREGSTASFNV